MLMSALSCASWYWKEISLPPLPVAQNADALAKKWMHYGAYYDKYETIYTAKLSGSWPFTKWEIYQDLRILTTEGAQYGTIIIPRYTYRIQSFEPRLYDAGGNEVPLDSEQMLSAYKENGKVVFPRVSAGCRITLRMVFFQENTVYSYCSFSWDEPVPIRIARFVHQFYPTTSSFDYKVRGTRVPLISVPFLNSDSAGIRVWLLKEFEPCKDQSYQENKFSSEPGLIVRLRKIPGIGIHFDTPKNVYSSYQDAIRFATAKAKNDPLIDSVVKRCVAGTQKIGTILRWVQKNIEVLGYSDNEDLITHSGIDYQRLPSILATGKASYLQTASICRALLEKAKIDTKMVVAFNRIYDEVDSTYMLYQPESFIPLLIVNVHNRPVVLYPYACGYAAGEYPLDFNHTLCIDPDSQRVYPLPPPVTGGRLWERERISIDLRSAVPEFAVTKEYRFNSAAAERSSLYVADSEALRKHCEELIKNERQSNRLTSFSCTAMDDEEKPLTLTMAFESDVAPVRFGEKKNFKLDGVINEFFSGITADRSEPIAFYDSATYVYEYEFLKKRGDSVPCDMAMRTITGKFFSASLAKSETDSSSLYCLTIRMSPVVVPKQELKPVIDDIAALNALRNANVVY